MKVSRPQSVVTILANRLNLGRYPTRSTKVVVAEFEAYLKEYDTINLSIITYYEIVSGLKHRDAHKQLTLFLDFATQNTILPFTQQVADIAAEIYADLRRVDDRLMILIC